MEKRDIASYRTRSMSCPLDSKIGCQASVPIRLHPGYETFIVLKLANEIGHNLKRSSQVKAFKVVDS